jgi:hypothetical protein
MAYAMELRRGEVIPDDEKLASMKLVPLMYISGADAAVMPPLAFVVRSFPIRIPQIELQVQSQSGSQFRRGPPLKVQQGDES